MTEKEKDLIARRIAFNVDVLVDSEYYLKNTLQIPFGRNSTARLSTSVDNDENDFSISIVFRETRRYSESDTTVPKPQVFFNTNTKTKTVTIDFVDWVYPNYIQYSKVRSDKFKIADIEYTEGLYLDFIIDLVKDSNENRMLNLSFYVKKLK